jgi:hypothetical protein
LRRFRGRLLKYFRAGERLIRAIHRKKVAQAIIEAPVQTEILAADRNHADHGSPTVTKAHRSSLTEKGTTPNSRRPG